MHYWFFKIKFLSLLKRGKESCNVSFFYTKNEDIPAFETECGCAYIWPEALVPPHPPPGAFPKLPAPGSWEAGDWRMEPTSGAQSPPAKSSSDKLTHGGAQDCDPELHNPLPGWELGPLARSLWTRHWPEHELAPTAESPGWSLCSLSKGLQHSGVPPANSPQGQPGKHPLHR